MGKKGAAAAAMIIAGAVGVAVLATRKEKKPPPELAKLTLTALTESLKAGGSTAFYVLATDAAGNPVSGAAPEVLVDGVEHGSFPPTGADGTSSAELLFAQSGTFHVVAQSGMVQSNTVTLTVAGAAESIQISTTATSVPPAGGTITVSGTTNAPAGRSMRLDYATVIGTSTTAYAGTQTAIVNAQTTFSFSFTIGANLTATNVTWQLTAVDTLSNVKSNTLSLTQPGSPTISIAASSTSLPAAGGTVTLTGTSNYGAGAAMYLFYNGVNSGSTLTAAGGGFSFSLTVAGNSSTVAVTDSAYCSDNSAGT